MLFPRSAPVLRSVLLSSREKRGRGGRRGRLKAGWMEMEGELLHVRADKSLCLRDLSALQSGYEIRGGRGRQI